MAEQTQAVQSNRPAESQGSTAQAAPPRPTGNVVARRAAEGPSPSKAQETGQRAPTDSAVTRPEKEEKGGEVGSLLQGLQDSAPAESKAASEQPAKEKPAEPKAKDGLTDEKLETLKSQIDSLGSLIAALEQRKGTMSRAALSTMVDGAQTVIDMVSAGLAGKAYNPADFTKRFGNLISSWRQTSEGNCVSVATIKAAMHKWGNKVFLDQKAAADGGMDLTLRDGHRMHLTPTELETARRLSRFRGADPQALEYANLCYAAIAKRAQQQGHQGARSFAAACHSLNDGEQVHYPAKLLGISDHLRRINVRDIPNHEIVVAWNAGHMIYGTNGVTDRWGAPASPWRWGLSGAYVLV